MKKTAIVLALLLVALLSLSGCEKQYTPDPAVEQFLNTGLTADKAYAQIVSATYTTTNRVQNAEGEETGVNTVNVSFDISDKDNPLYTNRQTYSGIYVQNDVAQSVSTVLKTADGFEFVTEKQLSDGSTDKTSRNVDSQFVEDLIRSHVFEQNGVYAEGGLYFGDYFLQYIYRYPPEAFYVDEEENVCVFDAVVHVNNNIGDTYIKQKIKINVFGLVTYYYEQYKNLDAQTTLTSETIPTYVFAELSD